MHHTDELSAPQPRASDPRRHAPHDGTKGSSAPVPPPSTPAEIHTSRANSDSAEEGGLQSKGGVRGQYGTPFPSPLLSIILG